MTNFGNICFRLRLSLSLSLSLSVCVCVGEMGQETLTDFALIFPFKRKQHVYDYVLTVTEYSKPTAIYCKCQDIINFYIRRLKGPLKVYQRLINSVRPSVPYKRDIVKEWRPRSDVEKRGVWSGSTLLAIHTDISIINDNTTTQSRHPFNWIGNL